MNKKVDVEEVPVLLSAKTNDDTLQIVPIEDTWRGQRLVSSLDGECDREAMKWRDG